uniref:Uncharacterized protein n=1 Tax=Panagrolaimus sp. PS1159 TaxID=55785 RepID=A0AC35G3G4_9BILA
MDILRVKWQKLMFFPKQAKMAAATDSEIYLLSIELDPEADSKALHCVYERTAASWIKSVCRHPLYSMAESFRRLIPRIYEEALVLGTSTTTTVNDITDKRQYMAD